MSRSVRGTESCVGQQEGTRRFWRKDLVVKILLVRDTRPKVLSEILTMFSAPRVAILVEPLPVGLPDGFAATKPRVGSGTSRALYF
jgi:hypothetical protein